ncbi:hypothetical protein HJFPF1_05991 [Paramyrothecium foliicola]|nr:hypothetical protein HJFPF1_05991 [Paramyrothecium foliicola]
MRNLVLLGGLAVAVGQQIPLYPISSPSTAAAPPGSLAAIDCTGDFTVHNASVAQALRENCRVVGGRVSIPSSYTGEINLDGVEAIRGGLIYNGCPPEDIENGGCRRVRPEPRPFTISSDTLREVRHLSLWAPNGLSRVVLPNLRAVNGTVAVRQALHLVELDLTGLKYISGFTLEAPRLETFKLDGLEGFTKPADSNVKPTVNLVDIGSVTSVDGLYKNPLDPLQLGEWYGPVRLAPGQNLTNVTLGWTRLPELVVDHGEDESLTVTLGGPNTTSMHIETLSLIQNGRFKRAPTLESLTVGKFEAGAEEWYFPHRLDLPFDNASDIHIQFYFDAFEPRYVTLPPQAVDWPEPAIWIQGYEGLQLQSLFDSEGRQTWYWPRSMKSLFIGAAMSNEFFTSFMEQEVVVKGKFFLQVHSDDFDCKVLERYNKRTQRMGGSDFTCWVSRISGATSLGAGGFLQAVLAASFVSWLLL